MRCWFVEVYLEAWSLTWLAHNVLYFPVAIDSGSRFEVAFPSGISHFLEKLAYRVRMGFDFFCSEICGSSKHKAISAF